MTRIDLPVRADRAATEDMLPTLRAAITAGDVEVNGSDVGQIGQAMPQLLVAARRSAEAAGHRFALTASDPTRATLTMAGADTLLEGIGL